MTPDAGIVAALATPLTEDEQLDTAGLRRLVEHVLAGGVRHLVVRGSTGEAVALRDATRRAVLDATLACAGERARVICGIAEPGTARAIEAARAAHRAGAHALLALGPFIHRHGRDEAVLEHFLDLAEASPLPIWLYNTPAQTHLNLSVGVVQQLGEHANIIGLKETTGDWGRFQELLQVFRNRADFALFQGVGYLLGYSVMLGAAGGVAGLVNLVPEFFVRLYEAARRKDVERVVRMQNVLLGYRQLVTPGTDTGIALIKAGLEMLGLCDGRATRPFAVIGAQQRAGLQAFVQECELEVEAAG